MIMQKINLYRYETNGRVTITPNAKNFNDEPSRFRLIADEGYVLTNGEINTPAIDIAMEDIELWSEIVEVEETSNNDLKAQAYDILMGVTE
jgi:predicted Zn-dependent protease